ncbi:DUF551 domain-containing protein [Enterobacter asburiae]|uniref:DUF551 domain-containing protein n=2 Tax=Enterobacter asburiae TaxID=61645 RepID=UPI0007958299|nr:DUF551 domain-containing protein [Enterobacter asburiae]MDU7758794.1 DUF551 domain-containing protein [Enterobacter asburiae]CZV10366.1 Protein of uncharacterised function (DUF551) [Enterobacter asburiae]SAD69225.1 Protein of uncharacterised function (DUF551) [Enterobacter asburiae]SAE22385.1 Protein of uncharacterised function (DUF551) [Enterobacter asburiae]SAF48218.1 Protein of uncharacterised function (DUF551) [Enterobacter asburiae]
MSTITKERVAGIASGEKCYTHDDVVELARIALASLETEPVCVIDQSNLDYLKSGSDADVWPASRTEMGDVLLYRAAPPAPVSVPDEDLLHMAASAIEDLLSNKDRYCAGVWADIPAKLRRAAMLQGADGTLADEGTIPAMLFKPVADLYGLTSPTGCETSFTFDAVEARDFIDGGWSCQEYVELERFQEAITNHTEDKLAMVDHSGDSNNMVEPVTTAYKLPANVIDALEKALQAMSFMGDTLNDMDAVCEEDIEYVTPAFDAVRKVLEGNYPVMPDGWVACSERMPDKGQNVLISVNFDSPLIEPLICSARYTGSTFRRGDVTVKPGEGAEEVTHWMPLPAAPQQEA